MHCAWFTNAMPEAPPDGKRRHTTFARAVVAAAVATFFAAGARAEDPNEADAGAEVATTQPAPEEPAAKWDLATTERLTGDWGGGRTWLEEHGITLSLSVTNIFQQNAHGGLRTHNAHRVSGSYDLELTLDTAAMKLWKGGTLYAYAEGSWDEGVSGRGYVGDLFGVNYDAGGAQEIQLRELWYEQSFFDEKLRVRFGKLDFLIDFNTNAFANDSTAQFLNSGLNFSPNMPIPDPGHGIQLVTTPCEWFYFGAGVADAEADVRETGFRTAYHGPDNFFSIYEIGFTPQFETGWGKLPGSYRFGLWYDPQPKPVFFDDIGGRVRTVPMKRDDGGWYMSFDQVVWRENPAEEGDEQGLGLFFRYTYAPGDANWVEDFWSVGGQYQGLIPTRDDDVVGFGVAQGLLSSELRKLFVRPQRETALELYYRIQVLPWLTISPDFQWILNPGGEGGRDAFVAGVRLQMAL